MSFNNFALKFSRNLPPEQSNKFSLEALKIISHLNLLDALFPKKIKGINSINLMGLNFPNRVGVAGGLDKNANYFHILGKLGFGFVEVGTITPLKQYGNPKPRVFRLIEDEALINRLGFNNLGAKIAELENAKNTVDDIDSMLNSSDINADKIIELSKKRSQLIEIVILYTELIQIEKSIEENNELLTDPEFKSLAEEELLQLKSKLLIIEDKIKFEVRPKDPLDLSLIHI